MTHRLFSLYRRVVLDRPVWTLFCVVAVVALLVFQIRGFEIEASADTLVLEGDSDLALFREVNARYRSQPFLLVAYRPKAALLADASLADIDALREALAAVPGVASVVTLLDVPLLASPPVALTDLAAGEVNTLRNPGIDRDQVLREFTTSPIYRDLLVSADGNTTALQINLREDPVYFQLLEERSRLRELDDTDQLDARGSDRLDAVETQLRALTSALQARQDELVAEVRRIIDQHRDQANIFLGGVPMIAADMITFVKSDLLTFGNVIGVFFILLLGWIFRHWVWVVLPLATCGLTVAGMIGLLAWLDWPMTVISSNFVALLLIITLSICIHLIVRYRELQRSRPDLDRHVLIANCVRAMGRPCAYTSLTTMVAFASLVISDIRPLIDFGWMMTIGVAVALLMAFVVVPAGLLVLPQPPVDRTETSAGLTPRLAIFTQRHGQVILLVSGILVVVSLWGFTRLEVENRFIDYFHQSTEIYQGMVVIDRELGGTIPLEVIIDAPAVSADQTGSDGDVSADPFDDPFADQFADDAASEPGSYWFTVAGMKRLRQVHEYLDQRPETGKVLSLATLYEVLQQLVAGPVDDIQLALVRRQMSDAIRDVMVSPYFDADADQARITVRVMETDKSLNRGQLLARIRYDLVHELGFEPGQARLTGMLVLYNNMLQSLFTSQILTLGAVFIAITLMFLVLFRSLALALLAIAPNILAAAIVLGGMGLAGLPLDMMTITIASIVVGIGVDNAIHYVHRFRTEFARDGRYLAAMHRCHGSIGRAMYYTSVTIIFGFGILVLSNFKPSIYFGLLTAAAMFAALAGALLLLPRLLVVLKPLGPERDRVVDADSEPYAVS